LPATHPLLNPTTSWLFVNTGIIHTAESLYFEINPAPFPSPHEGTQRNTAEGLPKFFSLKIWFPGGAVQLFSPKNHREQIMVPHRRNAGGHLATGNRMT